MYPFIAHAFHHLQLKKLLLQFILKKRWKLNMEKGKEGENLEFRKAVNKSEVWKI
jgi:hypothetical protein